MIEQHLVLAVSKLAAVSGHSVTALLSRSVGERMKCQHSAGGCSYKASTPALPSLVPTTATLQEQGPLMGYDTP